MSEDALHLARADRWCGRLAQVLGGIALLIAVSNLLFWWIPAVRFIASWPGVLVMRGNTALSIGCCALSLLAWQGAPRTGSHWRRRLASSLGLVAVIIGGVTSVEYLLGINTGLDTLFAPATFPGDRANLFVVAPGRMSLNASLALFFLGLSLVGVDWTMNVGRLRRLFISPILAVTAALPACFGLVGYLSGTGGFTGLLKSTNILLHTALSLVLVAVGVLALRSERQPVRRIFSQGASGMLLRRLLPGSTLALVVLAWLIGNWRVAGLVAHGEGTALMLFGGLVLLYGLIVSASRAVDVQEASVWRARLALQEEEQRSKSILKTSLDGVLLMDAEGRVVDWNAAAERIFGWRREEVLGRILADCVIPERTREAHRRGLETYMKTGRNVILDRRLELSALRRDGTEFPVEVSINVVADAEPPVFVGFIRDITARQKAEQALLEAKEQAEKASQAKDDFLAALSHELRTPLTPVLMSSSVLSQDMRLPEDVRHSLAMIERHVSLEARLIDDLLDLTRISRGKLLLRPEPCDITDLIHHAVAIIQEDAGSKGLKIELRLEPLESRVAGDSSRLQQVFWNLLKNAVKFTPPGGSITLVSRLDREQNRLLVEVRDTGIGFDPDRADQLFLPFEQEKSGLVHQFGGLGLGLAIAQAIMQLHGGSIQAASDGPGQGAVFTVSLPYEPLSADLPSSIASDARVPQEAGVRIFNILLVEDHEPTRMVMERLLKRAGHQVISAGSMTQALEVVEVMEVMSDVLISDLGLPDGSGLELMQTLRAQGRVLTGIALSGYGMEEDQQRTRAAGFDRHLVKPVKFEQLLQALAEIRPAM